MISKLLINPSMKRSDAFQQFVSMAKKDAEQAIISLCGFIPYDEALEFVRSVFRRFDDFDLPD